MTSFIENDLTYHSLILFSKLNFYTVFYIYLAYAYFGQKSESRACHRAVKVIKYLNKKLGRENIISKRPKRLLKSTDLEWSPYSPDLNG